LLSTKNSAQSVFELPSIAFNGKYTDNFISEVFLRSLFIGNRGHISHAGIFLPLNQSSRFGLSYERGRYNWLDAPNNYFFGARENK
jgi:hypothetical protein